MVNNDAQYLTIVHRIHSQGQRGALLHAADHVVFCDGNAMTGRQPLSSARIDELIQEGVFGCNPYELVRRLEEERGVFKTRPLTDEQIDAMWQQSCREHFSGLQREIHLARAIERAHGIK